jgi:hypothetical protein
MEIGITWFNDQFNIDLSSKPGAEAFLSIKGCRIAQGTDGAFVSYPATKNASTGKWWRHAWGSDGFNAAVLKKAQDSQQKDPAKQQRMALDEDIPF